MERKRILRSQQGFTLIEIISVLVLIGILAAVAVPKFIDLQADARNKAAEAAVAEGIAQVNLTSARYILKVGSAPDYSALTTAADPWLAADVLPGTYAAGDFTITFTDNSGTQAGTIKVSVTGDSGNVQGATAEGLAYLPTT